MIHGNRSFVGLAFFFCRKKIGLKQYCWFQCFVLACLACVTSPWLRLGIKPFFNNIYIGLNIFPVKFKIRIEALVSINKSRNQL